MNNHYFLVQRLIVSGSVLQQVDAAVELLGPEIERDDVSVDVELAYDLLVAAQAKLNDQAAEIAALRQGLRKSA